MDPEDDLRWYVEPPSAPHTHTIVFLHGRGDVADDFARSLGQSKNSQGQSIFEALPSVRWVFPQTKLRACVTQPGQRVSQWFDIWDVRDFSAQEELQAEGLRESVASIRRILATEIATLGGQSQRVVLAGISQGAATAVHTLFNLDLSESSAFSGQQQPPQIQLQPALGAFLGFSCRLPFQGRSLAELRRILGLDAAPQGDELLRRTPVLLEHCTDDPLVLVENGRALRDTLMRFGADVAWREYPTGGHWFNSPVGMDDVIAFLSTRVIGNTTPVMPVAPSQDLASADAMDLS
ncbi:Phospholipase/Carboxylesterase family protein [Xylariomycetidae sp. FL2044]|nr:Phospholipase/Carboxylesterase family protein [Xylariomycetidae sp. FL2044]